MDVIINETVFEVGVASVKRTVRREEKYNVMTEDGKRHREVRAVYLDFVLEIGNFGDEEYRALLELLAGPEASEDVVIEVDGENFVGYFDGISDEVLFEDDDGLWWDRLNLSFTGTEPWEGGDHRDDRYID